MPLLQAFMRRQNMSSTEAGTRAMAKATFWADVLSSLVPPLEEMAVAVWNEDQVGACTQLPARDSDLPPLALDSCNVGGGL